MPLVKKRLFRIRSTPPTTTPENLHQHQVFPLHIPELLELTLSSFSDHQLRLAAQVCRQWRAIAVQLLDRKIDWTLARADGNGQGDINWTRQPDTPERWRQLTRGKQWRVCTRDDTIQSLIEPRYEFRPESWNALTGTLREITRNPSAQQKGMELQLACLFDLQTNLLPLLSIVGSSLVSLVVDQAARRPVALESVMGLCPRLLHLSIASCWPFLINDDDSTLLDSEQEPLLSSSPSPHVHSGTFVLRSLVMSGILLRKSALLRVLRRCPDLRELRLSRFETVPAIPSSLRVIMGRATAASTMEFFESIAESCPQLQSLQFSKAFEMEPRNRAYTLEYHKRIAGLFPAATQWTFQVNDLYGMQPFNQKHFLGREHANLTTLVIEGPLLEAKYADDRLNSFLTCSSSSAHKLIHLRVTSVAISIWWWDLELREGHSQPPSKQTEPLQNGFFCAAIWRCRSLKTLHVRLKGKDDQKLGRTSMRIMCGYVSKVLPELEDLVLEKTLMDFEMDSGLCLLTRLGRLKRLTVAGLAYGKIVSGCLDWLAKDWARTSRGKKQLLNEWRLSRPGQIEETVAHAPFRSSEDPKPGDSVRDYMVDGIDMRYIGQVRDIVEVVKERLADGGMCWPQMEFLQLKIGNDRRQKQDGLVLEAKMREMRPEIEFELVRRCASFS
ncbi:hypothetical protein BGZ95_005225 [Linnemannia exigua]|uniref:F-box domain-containing protein n=1 Tax=Linnemannia exigua TaxID=604196 RepID=A0AAD4DIM0_9FUNG|nr:hypothetical protein BGZ95_005225 [Linnemannia exigua]